MRHDSRGGTGSAAGGSGGVNPHLQYVRYVLRHKWFVLQEARKLGVPLLGILHDLSKLRPSEWVPYADYFYGDFPERWPADIQAQNPGLRTKTDVAQAFDEAWLKHQHANKHHWQHWVLREDSGAVKVLWMPDRYRREMLADWRGAGRAITGQDNTAEWYVKNRAQMQLHPDTREWIERMLNVKPEGWVLTHEGHERVTA
jgi:hypothetical protein